MFLLFNPALIPQLVTQELPLQRKLHVSSSGLNFGNFQLRRPQRKSSHQRRRTHYQRPSSSFAKANEQSRAKFEALRGPQVGMVAMYNITASITQCLIDRDTRRSMTPSALFTLATIMERCLFVLSVLALVDFACSIRQFGSNPDFKKYPLSRKVEMPIGLRFFGKR